MDSALDFQSKVRGFKSRPVAAVSEWYRWSGAYSPSTSYTRGRPFRVPPCREGTIHLHTCLLRDSNPGPTAQWSVSLTTIPDGLHAEIVEVEIEVVSPSIVPSGNFAELNRTVTCMVLKANDRRTSCPCHDEFRVPRSDYVRQPNTHTNTNSRTRVRLCRVLGVSPGTTEDPPSREANAP
ncbi:hypothetical protein TNCV_1220121 [Trichonephila clavipes]|nr:hypothetical protein TNCV_1220121 [Trichonephila clavipes]